MSNCATITDYKTAFECFRERFLNNKKSIFSDSEILNQESIQFLIDNFVNKGLGGDNSFIDKIKMQLIGDNNSKPKFDESITTEEDKETIQKNAIEVLAHIVWLWRLVPSNAKISSTIASVQEILKLNSELEKITLDNNPYFNDKIKGIASTGTYYNTNKPFEIAFVIRFLEKLVKADPKTNYIECLLGDDSTGQATITTENSEDSHTKSASIFHALLHFLEPKNYEAIVSMKHKESIVSAFENLIEDGKECDTKFEPEIDYKLHCIRKKLENDKNKNTHFFYQDYILEQWNPTVLPAKNVIYYGAPGTGKTYEILELVKRKAQAQDGTCPTKYYKVVQFHPSYNYEDFIDGIKPVKATTNGIQLELVNGIFKEMCIEAYKELEKAKNNNTSPKQFYFIADEINRAELSRVFGELLLCLEEDKRLRFEDSKLKGELIKTQNSPLWEDEHAVVKIEDELYFGIPQNIYFLGTMNDIDRSIDSFDLALRRRFKWVHKGCNYDVVTEHLLAKDIQEDALVEYLDEKKGRCVLLNQYINETLNLGSSYELGHTYFMKIKVHGSKISKSAYENLFDFEIGPLVTEYLRAEYPSGKELETKLKEMRDIFTGKK